MTLEEAETEIRQLRGETLAHSVILIAVCRGLAEIGPELKEAVRQAFDNAETFGEIGAMQIGSRFPKEHLRSWQKVMTDMRNAVVDDDGEPKKAI